MPPGLKKTYSDKIKKKKKKYLPNQVLLGKMGIRILDEVWVFTKIEKFQLDSSS